jgi:Flp pilus assembly protein TadG
MTSFPSNAATRPGFRAGQSLVVVALLITALFGFAALSVDVGKLYFAKKRLQNGTDAASLAAVKDLPLLGAQKTNYVERAHDFADANKVPSAQVTSVEAGHFTEGGGFVAGQTPLDSVRVCASRPVDLAFGPVIGLPSMTVSACSVAQGFRSDSITGIAMPWAIDSFDPGNPPSPCQEVTLRFASAPNGGSYTTSPSDNSATVYEQRIHEGYPGTISIGDTIYSLQGMKTGPNREGVAARISRDPSSTCQTVQNDSPRLVVLPYVAFGAFGGGTGTWTSARVLGFVVFFLERTEDNGKVVVGKYRTIFAGSSVTRQPPQPAQPAQVFLVQ